MPTRKPAKQAQQHKSSAGKNGHGGNGSKRHGASGGLGVLKAQHEQLETCLKQLAKGPIQTEAVNELRRLWAQHATLEDEVVIPALREAGVDDAALYRFMVERELGTCVIEAMGGRAPADPAVQAMAQVLAQMFERIARPQEEDSNGLYAKVDGSGTDVEKLGKRLAQATAEFERRNEDSEIELPRPRLLGDAGRRGRPSRRSLDDEGRGYAGSMRDEEEQRAMRRSSPRHDDDYDDDRHRDDRDRGRSYASQHAFDERRDRYRDDDRGYGRGEPRGMRSGYDDEPRRGRGGWYGDTERHAKASHQGWDERRSPAPRDDDEDDRHRRMVRRRSE